MEAESWLAKTAGERQRLLAEIPLNPHFLDIVRAPDGWGVFASAGPNFRHAIFGRDSIETAADLCAYDRQLVHDVIITLARLQGVAYNQQSEEEPGKIHHEYRAYNFAGVVVPPASIEIMHHLQSMWGNAGDDTMLYYGAYDSTPLYIRLVERYTATYGNEILDESYIDRGGQERAVRHSVLLAANWLSEKLRMRDDHLFAYRRHNPQGLENQVWKDSRTSYLFADGSMPNLDAGIASVELQGYAYDALIFAATLAPDRAEEFKFLAADVQRATIDRLWMPNANFFAQGLAFDDGGQERLIDTLTSNAGLLLDSRILANLQEDESRQYVEGVATAITGPEFRTAAGIRCRATRHAGIPGFADYHGTYAVWPKETFDIAQGLERFGYRREAMELYGDIVNSVQKSGEFYEFFYADPDGTVWYDGSAAMVHFSKLNIHEPLPVPEPGQAWTIAAAVASSYKTANQPAKTPATAHSIVAKQQPN